MPALVGANGTGEGRLHVEHERRAAGRAGPDLGPGLRDEYVASPSPRPADGHVAVLPEVVTRSGRELRGPRSSDNEPPRSDVVLQRETRRCHAFCTVSVLKVKLEMRRPRLSQDALDDAIGSVQGTARLGRVGIVVVRRCS